MSFRAELTTLVDLRTSQREPISASAAVRGDGIRAVADVQDISPKGARLVTQQPLALGSRVSVKLPFVQQPMTATVVWTKGLTAGCEFEGPLQIGLFEVLKRHLR